MTAAPPAAPISVPRVIVDAEAPTDAALYEDGDGTRVLVLRPVQSFSNAVTQITHLLPGIHPDRVRHLVRLHLPDAADFETIETVWRRQTAKAGPVDFSSATKDRRCTIRTVLVNFVLWSVAAMAVAGYMVVDTMDDGQEPYQSKEFQHFVAAGKMICKQIDTAHAQCTDLDGTMMLSSVLTSPDATLFTFTYGKQQVSMRVFPNEDAARMWASGGGVQRMMGVPEVAGRYVFYGTDAARVDAYADLVRGVSSSAPAASAIPERLVGLALGSLNLPDDMEDVSPSQDNAVSALMGKPVKPSTRLEVRGPVEVESLTTPPGGVPVRVQDLAAALPQLLLEDDLAPAIAGRVAAAAPPKKASKPRKDRRPSAADVTAAPTAPRATPAAPAPTPAPNPAQPAPPSASSPPPPEAAPTPSPTPTPTPEPTPTPTPEPSPTPTPDLGGVLDDAAGVVLAPVQGSDGG